MKIYLKEKIGNAELFSGRKNEQVFFLKWIDGIKREISMSTALLSRRKTGKTALLQRLYNITFERNNGVIPFYYEVEEGAIWSVDFCKSFFLTFIYQYIAFKSRNAKYINLSILGDFNDAVKSAQKEGQEHLIQKIKAVRQLALNEDAGIWRMVRDAPHIIATEQQEFIVQIIDEFQYLNSEVYRDKNCQFCMIDFAAGYMKTAEYKNAPLLISGSQVGWLRNILFTMLPSRFKHYTFNNMPESESIEMIVNYSGIMDIPVNKETVMIISNLCEGNPFYISSMFESNFAGKDFTNLNGVLKTVEYETLDNDGGIKAIWMEYIRSVFGRVNEKNAKNIVLYLSKHRQREITRKELLDELQLDMTDFELEQKLRALEKADIIEEGLTNFDYKGVQDNIFDKVFRGVYQKEIQKFDPREITNEYKALLVKAQKKYRQLTGEINREKGLYAEYFIIQQLRYRVYKNDSLFQSFTKNLPEDFKFIKYSKVWSYKTAPVDGNDINIDIFAKAENQNDNNYSLICEVKNREKKFSKKDAKEFLLKVRKLVETENIEKHIGLLFSISGFTPTAIKFLKENSFAYSNDARWFKTNP